MDDLFLALRYQTDGKHASQNYRSKQVLLWGCLPFQYNVAALSIHDQYLGGSQRGRQSNPSRSTAPANTSKNIVDGASIPSHAREAFSFRKFMKEVETKGRTGSGPQPLVGGVLGQQSSGNGHH